MKGDTIIIVWGMCIVSLFPHQLLYECTLLWANHQSQPGDAKTKPPDIQHLRVIVGLDAEKRRQILSWINEHKNVGRVAALMLLLVAIMGPWTYTSDGVGPAAWCRDPNILLENGRCVKLVSGTRILTFMAGAFLSMSVGLVTGATVLPDRAREFLGVFLFTVGIFLLVLPFFTTLLLIRGGDSRRQRVFHVMAWGLAAVLGLLLALLAGSESGLYSELWGIWLYTGLTASALILEGLALAAGRKPNQRF